NIIDIYDLGVDHDQHYHVLEVVEGTSLFTLIEQGGGISPSTALRVAMSVAGALQYIHDRGMVHGATDPRNIVIRSTGAPVVVDFTDAVPLKDPPSSADSDSDAIETLVLSSRETDSAPRLLDLWGLGATLYCALTATPWRRGMSLVDMRHAVQADLGRLRDQVPASVAHVVERCLADPPNTYRTADELKRALEATIDVLEGSQDETVPDRSPEAGQTLLLHVEYQEAAMPGAYREYAIDEPVSEGAFGEVYRGREVLTDRTVALKILKSRWVQDRQAVARFRREAMIMARLDHENIVRVHNFGRYGQSFFIAMEYLAGPTLREVIGEQCPMTPALAVGHLRAILRGLEALATAGIVHRDLKPSNIKIAGDRLVLFDFGVSLGEGLEQLTSTGDFVGTLAYAAPEQLRGNAVTPASDIYAAGVILYQLLTARRPIEADSHTALIGRLVAGATVPITEHRGDLPPVLTGIVSRMIAADPTQRPTAREAMVELAELSSISSP
ncbi:MAG: protein kinase, partial [Deltaproteobacteria bacterium]|nr:protein kinase [Deltaproteobacteria bacterium]